MTLTFLGAGSAFSRQYGTTCSLLETPSQERWLLDCGRQAPEQLDQARLSWHDIDGQLITHAHGDHIYGLEEFAFARYYNGLEDHPSLLTGGERPKLVAHHAVLAEVWESLAPSLRYIERGGEPRRDGALEDYFEKIAPRKRSQERDEAGFCAWESFEVSELKIHARSVPHVPLKPSSGFEIEWQGQAGACRVWWSGDSRVESDFLVEIARRCSVMFQDCSFAPNGGEVHGDVQALLALPLDVRKKIVLMHHDDELDQNSRLVLNAGFRLAFPGQVYDLEAGICIKDKLRRVA